MKRIRSKFLKVIFIIVAVIVLFIIVSFIRHKICSFRARKLLTPLGKIVEVNGHNMSVYTEGEGDKTLVFLSGGEPVRPYWILKLCSRG